MLKAHHSPVGPCWPSLWRLININATGKGEKWMSWEGSRSLLFSGGCLLVLIAFHFQVVGWWHKIQTSFPQFNHVMCDFDICKSILLIMKSMLYYAFYTKNVMHFPFSQLTFVSKYIFLFSLSSVQFSSVTQSCPTFCNPMNRSTPGLPVHHKLQEFTQTHVHRVSRWWLQPWN